MEQKVTITLTFTRAEAETLHNSLDDWQSRLENREDRIEDGPETVAHVKLEQELVWLVREALSEALWPQPQG